jgi:signal transduction histidine kinase
MRFIDMSDYPPAARAMWFTIVIAGGVAIVFAFVTVAELPAPTQLRIGFAALVAGIIGLFPVDVPSRTAKIAVEGGDMFVFLALLLYGPSAATLVCAGAGCVAVLRASKRATSRIFSPTNNALTVMLASWWYPAASAGLDQARSLVLLFVVASLFILLQTAVLQAIFALKASQPIRPLLWAPHFLWTEVSALASASVAAVLYMSERHLGFEAILIAMPLVAMFVGGMHFYFEKKKADERHVVELQESERRLQEALTAAEHASRAKTRFLAAASHDLRQPLHALSFLTAALDMRPLDGSSREITRKMTDALEDLSAEFDALLDISKLDAGLVTISASSFEAEPFLRRIAEAFVPLTRARGVVFQVRGDSGVFIRTDRPLLERIVRNLLDNAFKYTEKGTVRLACTVAGGRCMIEIADTGIGIPEAEHEHVFEEFYQVGNPERDRRKGMGLGLSIVRRLANLLGVKLSMDSSVGRGTTFVLELETVAAPQRVDEAVLAPSTELADCQVLLIDDEVAPRDALRGYLEGLGCNVSVAGTLAEAAAVAMLEEPDIVLADYRLRQGETGLEAIRRLRASRPGLPAIIITGDTAPERLAELDGAGIQVLHKPVAPARLVESMVIQLAGTEAPAQMLEAGAAL